MRRLSAALAILAAPLAAVRALHAQAPGTPAGLPPARPLGAVEARATEPLGSLAAVRALPGGRVLVNDVARRRVVLFDSTLATYTVVADSTAATGNAYTGPIAGLIPYRGDSTLFVDPQSLSMLVIDPAGKLGRTMAVPRPGDAFALTGLAFGTPGFDARGRLVYRNQPRPTMTTTPGGGIGSPVFPDSAAIVRVDLATRAVDTAAFVRMVMPRVTMSQSADGRMSFSTTVNPLAVADDWAVLSDGTIAVLRGRDFHADLIGADGALRSAPKVPHPWQRLSDADKSAFLDSARTAMEKQRAELQARMAGGPSGSTSGTAPGATAGPPAGGPPAGGGTMTIVMAAPGAAPGRDGGPPPRGGTAAPAVSLPTINLVSASELPDYKPPFAAGGARADADGRVWVRTVATQPMPGPVYDVIDGQGHLVDRVVLPPDSAIAGFGSGGVVYLGIRDATGVHLARARAR